MAVKLLKTMSKETKKEISKAFDHVLSEYEVKIDEIVPPLLVTPSLSPFDTE